MVFTIPRPANRSCFMQSSTFVIGNEADERAVGPSLLRFLRGDSWCWGLYIGSTLLVELLETLS